MRRAPAGKKFSGGGGIIISSSVVKMVWPLLMVLPGVTAPWKWMAWLYEVQYIARHGGGWESGSECR